jgi:GntR family transcriptional regulator
VPPTRTPMYRRIAGELRAKIHSGELPPGGRLPTEPELAEQYGVSRNTVRLALGQLINEGMITATQGRGTFVREHVVLTTHASTFEAPNRPALPTDAYVSEVLKAGRKPSQDFEMRIVEATSEVAERLCVDEGEAVILRRCLRRVDGEGSSIQDTYYPMDLAQEHPLLMSPKDIPQGTTRYLAEGGHPQVGYLDELTTRMPGPEEARFFEVPAGVPVLVHVRTGYTTTRPVRVTVTVHAGDRNRLVYELDDLQALYDGERKSET